MTAELIGQFAIWYVVFLFSLTVHEGAHALSAYLGGDDTAYRGGQVTLNPAPHIRREPFGTVVVPLLSFFTAGWVMGWASTPYDPAWSKRYPRRQALMAAAGPAANFAVALVALILLRLFLAAGWVEAPDQVDFSHLVAPAAGGDGTLILAGCMFLSVALNLNVLLGLFNLLPLPPLDGAGILEGLLPGSAGRLMESMRTQPGLSVMGLLLAWKLFGLVASPAMATVLKLVHPAFSYS